MSTRGRDITSQTKSTIFSVYNYFKRLITNVPNMTIREAFHQTQNATAEACSVSLRTVQRLTVIGNTTLVDNDKGSSGDDLDKNIFPSPERKRPHKKWRTDLDNFDKDVVRRTVEEFYSKGQYPTCDKLKIVLREKIGFMESKDSVWKILKDLGFQYKKCNDGRKFLMERNDIVASRMAFLRKMHDIRLEQNPRPIIYLDETWVNQNHSRKHVWLSGDNEGGFRVPVGKGLRLILCHAGSAHHGFINGAQLLFQSKSNEDYHQEMNYDIFHQWFVDLLSSLEEGSVIVMDNASYHSKLIDKPPSTKTKKADILKWLAEKGIRHNPSHTVAELLSIVRQHKHKYERQYELDNLALQMGHEVVRLPPYHCQYNPIEMVWAQVKGEVAQKNTTFKIIDIKKLLEDAVRNVSIDDWKRCVNHAERLQEEDFIKEGLRDEIMKQFIINLEDESDSEEFSES